MSASRALTLQAIASLRLRQQRLIGAPFPRLADAVGWFGAVQAQDYAGAKWGLAQRLRTATDEAIDQAFARGEILRTHVLRPTWHFVRPEDIRWLLALSAARVKTAMSYYWKKHELDARTFARSQEVLAKALRGGRELTRNELGQRLEAAGIAASGERLGHLLMHAELDALICSGPRRGKQFTYAWLDDRVPAAPPRDREAALAELARRYFQSHGPAAAHDFAWWSGLTVTEARAAIGAHGGLVELEVEGRRFFAPREMRASAGAAAGRAKALHLLPNYDEHVVAYKDHAATLEPAIAAKLARARGVLDKHLIAVDGRVVGGWRRELEKEAVVVEVRALVRLDRARQAALKAEAERYGRFVGMPVRVVVLTG